MSIIVNNNLPLSEKNENVTVYDRERKVSVVEVNDELLGLSKMISFQDEEEGKDSDHDYNFVPTVSCDNYEYVNVYGHNQM